MTPHDIVFLLGDIALLSAIPALSLFVVYYYFGSPWKTLMVGRSLMYFAVSLLAIIGIITLSAWLGADYFLREWVRLLGFVAVSVTTWRLFLTLRHIQKKGPVALEEIGLTDAVPVGPKPHFWSRRPRQDQKLIRNPNPSKPESEAQPGTGEVKTQ